MRVVGKARPEAFPTVVLRQIDLRRAEIRGEPKVDDLQVVFGPEQNALVLEVAVDKTM